MGFLTGLFNILLVLSSLFLICLVLIQRGKGGGLAGAFGGPGGSSAFGTKAGDLFTRITIITAAVWIVLAIIQVLLVNRSGSTSAFQAPANAGVEVPLPGTDPAGSTPAGPSSSDEKAATAPPLDAPTNSGIPSALGEDEPGAPVPSPDPSKSVPPAK